jgi:hypothetical protein
MDRIRLPAPARVVGRPSRGDDRFCGEGGPPGEAFTPEQTRRYFFFLLKTEPMEDFEGSPRWRTFNWPRIECQPM